MPGLGPNDNDKDIQLGLIQDPTGSIRQSLEQTSRLAKSIQDRSAKAPAEADHEHGHEEPGHPCRKEATGTCCGGCKRKP